MKYVHDFVVRFSAAVISYSYGKWCGILTILFWVSLLALWNSGDNHCDSGEILQYDDVIKWKHFPRYWPFLRGIHRSPVNSPHKEQWRGA